PPGPRPGVPRCPRRPPPPPSAVTRAAPGKAGSATGTATPAPTRASASPRSPERSVSASADATSTADGSRSAPASATADLPGPRTSAAPSACPAPSPPGRPWSPPRRPGGWTRSTARHGAEEPRRTSEGQRTDVVELLVDTGDVGLGAHRDLGGVEPVALGDGDLDRPRHRGLLHQQQEQAQSAD